MKLLILDLDETLIHGTTEPIHRDADFLVGEQFHVYIRPYLGSFLEYAFANFEVAVWTSASADYAAEVVHNIIPTGKTLRFLWSNERCTRKQNLETWETYWVKDLKKVKKLGYSLDRVLMVDDSPEKLSKNYGNYIKIREYEGDQSDDDLKHLPWFLDTLLDVDDVRPPEKRGWKNGLQSEG